MSQSLVPFLVSQSPTLEGTEQCSRPEQWPPQVEAGPHVRSRPSPSGPGDQGSLSCALFQSCAGALGLCGGLGEEGQFTGEKKRRDSGLSIRRDVRSGAGLCSGRVGSR